MRNILAGHTKRHTAPKLLGASQLKQPKKRPAKQARLGGGEILRIQDPNSLFSLESKVRRTCTAECITELLP